jgi:CubicO group peptidase (beta-lactamase class C family)
MFNMLRTLATVLLAVSLHAQTTLPDTPAGRGFSAWLEAFNSGSHDKCQAYLKRFEPNAPDRCDQMSDFHEQTGGFDVVSIQKSEPLHLEVIVKERGSTNQALAKMDVKDSDPPEVTGLGIRLIAGGAGTGPAVARLSLEEAARAVDGAAAEAAVKDRFSGALLVAKDGKVLLEKAYGLGDRESGAKNTVDTQFRLGSMNKMFTATAALQLVGQGKLQLDGTVGKYVPDYPNKEIASKVTIRHLLTHTGATGDIFTEEYDKHRLEVREPADYVKLFGARGPQFEPGSKWEYSNYGFVLLGYIVERVSGESYYAYVRKHIFQPAGMTATDSLPESEKVTKRATGYMKRKGAWVSNADTLPWRGSPAGGGYSTVGDLLRFAQALSSGKLLNKELFAAMTSVQAKPEEGQGMTYGYGMSVHDNSDFKSFGHGGGAPGMNGDLRVYPNTGIVAVALANMDPPAASRLIDFFQARMPLH